MSSTISGFVTSEVVLQLETGLGGKELPNLELHGLKLRDRLRPSQL